MKKILAIAIMFSMFSMFAAGAYAITVNPNQSDIISPFNTGNTQSPIQSVTGAASLLISIVQWAYTIFYIVAVLFILVAAYNFVQGGSNPKAVETAKAQLKYAVIAIVVALIASGVALVLQRFLQQRA